MRSYTKTVYVADDGREFDSDLDCRMHEKQHAIVSWLRDDPDLWLDEDVCAQVVQSLLRKFDITERSDL